jgi:hypothetical protein
MGKQIGKVKPGSTIYCYFDSFGTNGEALTMTGLAVGDILIYKDGSTTERASTAGFTLLDTDGIDFDGKTGIHGFSISLADNTTAGFYAAGSKYTIVIASITINSQTVNFVYGDFEIAMDGAELNTTIATLASQTSFTLTAGPAEDDALNGCEMYAHDVASAVQAAYGTVLDYTGSTKTVTLAVAPTYTMATTDNVSFFRPTSVMKVLGSLVNALVSGRVDVSVGAMAANVMTAAAAASDLTTELQSGLATQASVNTIDDFLDTEIADIQARLPAALVGGRMDANIGAISSDATAADNAEAFFDGTGYAGTGNVIPTVTTLTGHTAQTGDTYARLGAPVGASISADIAAAKANLVTILATLGTWTATGVNTVLGAFKAIMRKDSSLPSDIGGTYDPATDSLEFASEDAANLRDFGIMQVTTIATLASQTSFTLTAGSADNSAYFGAKVMITDATTEEQKAVGVISAYTGSTKTVTLQEDPAIFTMAVGDHVTIMAPSVDVFKRQVDGTTTFEQGQRLQNSAAAGKVSGAATTTVVIRDLADTKDRITATVDADGNRTAVTKVVT